MAYSPFTSAQVAVGEATKTELFTKLKDNDDDHETRIAALESASVSGAVPYVFHIADSGDVLDDAKEIRIAANITITSVILSVIEAGTAGTLEVDVLSNQGGSFSTVLSGGNLTRAFGDGNRSSVTSSGIAVADNDLDKYLRLDVKAVQTGMRDAFVTINYTVR